MRDLAHKRRRYIDTINNYSSFYQHTDKREQLLISSSILNFLWNQWNHFWRDYWLAHINGGIDVDSNPILSVFPSYDDKQACHYLLHLCGKRGRHTVTDRISGSYQEATWGDPDIITQIATGLLSSHSHMGYVLGLLSTYQTTIEHFQKIRNSFIHLNSENIRYLENITAYYTFSNGQGLIDILDSTRISNGQRCFNYLCDDMQGMIQNL